MTGVVWTAEAIGDLDAVRGYIGRDSPNYANVVCADIISAVRQLESFPESGRIVPELQRDVIRELVRGGYRIVYWLRSNERVEVLTVFHGARLLRLEAFG